MNRDLSRPSPVLAYVCGSEQRGNATPTLAAKHKGGA